MSEPPRVMMIGAHPDDCDFKAGGCAALWRRQGCAVKFVSATNGDAGHETMGGGQLARRRVEEARRAGAVVDIEYICLDNHDAELVPSLERRLEFIRVIREFRPDLLLTHRPWDYHPDHRYTSQLVQDASFLVTVPNVCPQVEPLAKMPVILYTEDHFRKPLEFCADVVVDIDEVIWAKGDMLHEHESQVYEWLARGSEVPAGETERRAWIRKRVWDRSAAVASRFRERLIAHYGRDRGARVETAEAFEVCEYGSPLTELARTRLFPF